MPISEKKIQELIADFPWLLSLSYERAGLSNRGMEYRFLDGKRLDLVLRESVTQRPVFVEFKANDLSRDNLGQILEYRTLAALEANSENSALKELFGNQLLSPKLLLVVPRCTDEARIGCNLAGIEVFEFEKSETLFTNESQIRALDSALQELKHDVIPFGKSRWKEVDKVYAVISRVLSELDLSGDWKVYKQASGEYHYNINHAFINKWIFSNRGVSIGIYEPIFEASAIGKIFFEFYSVSESNMQDFLDRLRKELAFLNNYGTGKIWEQDDGYYCTYSLNKRDFVANIGGVVGDFVKVYLKCWPEK